MNLKRALVVCKHENGSMPDIEGHGIDLVYSWKNTLTPKDLQGFDFIISIGGDGTALSASHYLINKPLLSVNSAPESSEGALTTLTLDKLKEKLVKISKGDFEVESLERIDVYVNGKVQEPIAWNDIFFASVKAYHISKYIVNARIGGVTIEEIQKSSGLIFATGAGSTAWYRSAGGKPFGPQEKVFKMIVREPYQGRIGKFKLLNATFGPEDWIKIKPLVPSVLAIDSIREFLLDRGDDVEIRQSRHPLLRIR